VRKSFKNVLPHPKTISKWYKVVKWDPGFTREAFQCTEEKVKNGTLICNIVLDEMRNEHKRKNLMRWNQNVWLC